MDSIAQTDEIERTISRYASSPFQKPIAAHNRVAFAEVDHAIHQQKRSVILDCGCGTGDSTRALAQLYPDHLVIGIDKSAHRLGKERMLPLPANCLLVRADLIDFYRLAAHADWPVSHHFLLYPNPWPKPGHLKRRWHGSPIFPALCKIGQSIELRTNRRFYADEFLAAMHYMNIAATHDQIPGNELEQATLTPFERKYHARGEMLWRIIATPG